MRPPRQDIVCPAVYVTMTVAEARREARRFMSRIDVEVAFGHGCSISGSHPVLRGLRLFRSSAADALTPADAGLASGLVSTTAQVGGALGLAVLASVASSHAHGSHTLSAIVGGYHVAFLIGAISWWRRWQSRSSS